jgi:hypothetical protein
MMRSCLDTFLCLLETWSSIHGTLRYDEVCKNRKRLKFCIRFIWYVCLCCWWWRRWITVLGNRCSLFRLLFFFRITRTTTTKTTTMTAAIAPRMTRLRLNHSLLRIPQSEAESIFGRDHSLQRGCRVADGRRFFIVDHRADTAEKFDVSDYP